MKLGHAMSTPSLGLLSVAYVDLLSSNKLRLTEQEKSQAAFTQYPSCDLQLKVSMQFTCHHGFGHNAVMTVRHEFVAVRKKSLAAIAVIVHCHDNTVYRAIKTDKLHRHSQEHVLLTVNVWVTIVLIMQGYVHNHQHACEKNKTFVTGHFWH